MRGLEIARQYYDEFGAAAIHEAFPLLEGKIAVGLAGSGSECYGFDDETSRDHDFEPGFCLWIPEEDEIDSRTAFQLERMYAKLPKEYLGLKRNLLQPAGGRRRGVIRFSEFLERHIGRKDAFLSTADWFTIPECALSEVVNGEVWRDDSGRFTEMRGLIGAMPEDVRLKKLAGSLYCMGQSGSYNYGRCLAHGETGAAQLALAEFSRHAMHVAFLLNHRYMPFYKWSFRALRELTLLPSLSESLSYLLNTGNEPAVTDKKKAVIEECTGAVSAALQQCALTDESSDDPGRLAFSINDRIRDPYVRNTEITAGVNTAF